MKTPLQLFIVSGYISSATSGHYSVKLVLAKDKDKSIKIVVDANKMFTCDKMCAEPVNMKRPGIIMSIP
jgi:hypothetical protein